jgi:hypothetical protein
MKTSSLARFARRSLLVSIVPLTAFACSAAPPSDAAAGSSTEALGSSCGRTPKAPICNLPKCTVDGWMFYAMPNGSSCKTATGASGLCEGGNVSTETLGHCLPTISGVIDPQYYVVTVLYAPPGTASTVDYGQGQSFGTTTTTKSSWSNEVSLTVANKGTLLGFGSGGLSISGSEATQHDSSTAIDVKATTQTDFTLDGLEDVIDHDLDRIYLWLNPQIDVSANGSNVSWAMTTRDGQNASIVYVTPAWLKGVSPMPNDVAQALAAANITPAQYPELLARDPFGNGSTALDPLRFAYQTEFPYEGVAVKGQNPTPTLYTINKSMSTVVSNGASTTYTVGITAKGGVDFFGLLQADLTVADKMTWKSENDFAATTGTTMSAVASIMQPAFGYEGPIHLNVYMDTVYNTFLFVLN